MNLNFLSQIDFVKIKQIKGDWTAIFLCMVWGASLLSFIKAVVLRLPLISSFADYIVPALTLFALIKAWKDFSKNIRPQELLFYVIGVFAFLSSYIIFPQNSEYLDEYFLLYLGALLYIFVGVAININKLYEPFYLVSLLYVAFRFIIDLFFDQGMEDDGYGYDMVGAYMFLPHYLMVLGHLFKKINVVDLIAGVLGLFLLFGFGTRGPLLCIGIFIACYFLFCISLKKSFWLYAILISACVLLVANFTSVLEYVDTYVEMYNMSSRIIDSINNDTIADDNGRTAIHVAVLNALSQAGPLGLGICGDRVASHGAYSHDIFIEILASFGYYLGSIIIISMVLLFVMAYKRCKTQEEKVFLIVLLSFWAHHFLTGSFLSSTSFFMLIGFSIRMVNKGYFNSKESCRLKTPTVKEISY